MQVLPAGDADGGQRWPPMMRLDANDDGGESKKIFRDIRDLIS